MSTVVRNIHGENRVRCLTNLFDDVLLRIVDGLAFVDQLRLSVTCTKMRRLCWVKLAPSLRAQEALKTPTVLKRIVGFSPWLLWSMPRVSKRMQRALKKAGFSPMTLVSPFVRLDSSALPISLHVRLDLEIRDRFA